MFLVRFDNDTSILFLKVVLSLLLASKAIFIAS